MANQWAAVFMVPVTGLTTAPGRTAGFAIPAITTRSSPVKPFATTLSVPSIGPSVTATKMRLWAWGINMRAGDINFQHVHPDAKVSGVYYVSVPPCPPGSAAEEGAIMFVDPRPRAHMNRVPNQTTEITVMPQPGMLIIFPSYYEHAVIPFRGPGVRVCIAFNANV